ncbi:MAG: hypothetical protein Q8K23_12075 [Sulfuritalea sp.]|nr:hypothetical protein [Sulfuritalea sp.]
MSFWSGEKLAAEGSAIFSDFDPSRIDCAAYTLRLGDEAFVTSDKFYSAAPGDSLLVKLEHDAPKRTLKIPPGQFGFLITEESVHVPNSAIAFISVKTTYKFRGLINVSGFHVDPGWDGKLIFGVYNAGASDIILERGQALFLIFFADLDNPNTASHYKGNGSGRKGINAALIQGMTGQVFSPLLLQREMKDIQGKVKKMEIFESRQALLWQIVKLMAAGLSILIVFLVASDLGRRSLADWLVKLLGAAGYIVSRVS